MKKQAVDDDWDENDWDDNDDDEPTMPCPHCKREIHEDSQRCPYCGDYISEEDSPSARKPWWIIAGVLVVLYIIYRWVAE